MYRLTANRPCNEALHQRALAARHGQRFNLDSKPSQIKSAILALPLGLKTFLVRELNVASSYNFDLNPLRITAAFGLQALRQQRLLFNRAEEARAAYFARLDRLAQQGFIDASRA